MTSSLNNDAFTNKDLNSCESHDLGENDVGCNESDEDDQIIDLSEKVIDPFPYKLHWVFGHDTNVNPINISSSTIKGIFFVSGAVGICYDWVKNSQKMLLGHVSSIVATAVTSDKIYLATADEGSENSLIIWHAKSGDIVYVVSGYFPDEGVKWMCFSDDDNILMTLSGGIPQKLSLWNWKSKELFPFISYQFKDEDEYQHFTFFHPKDSCHFTTCSKRNVSFFKLDKNKITATTLDLHTLYDEKACKQAGDLTQTIFLPVSSLAITGTSKGKVILWDRPLHSKDKSDQTSNPVLTIDPKQRVCLRMMQVFTSHCSLTYLGNCEDLIVVGTSESRVCFFDEKFQLQWSVDIDGGSVTAVSFNFKPRFTFKQAVLKALGKKIEKESPLERNDFIACTNNGYAGYVNISSSEMTDVLLGTSYAVKSVAVHPSRPYIYIGDYNGELWKWNYDTKALVNKDLYQDSYSEIECLTIDRKGNYLACAFLSGRVAIFDAVSFTAKPCFTADTGHRLALIKFSPDPQHLIVIDEAAYVYRYQLHLIVPPEIYHRMGKDKILEEPVWYFNGKSHQHRGKIIDCVFNSQLKSENLYFFTLGEDRFIIQYNITNSRNMELEVSKRMNLDSLCVPLCMCLYPLYNITTCIAVISDDGKLRVYNMEDENMIKMVSIPLYEEPLRRISLLGPSTHVQDSDRKQDNSSLQQYFIFHTTHSIGLAKFPIDGNPNTSLALASHPKGIKAIVTNYEESFLFTAGLKDSWIYMYEMNVMALVKSEKESGQDLDAFKNLFPMNTNPDEMKKRLVYSVYALESEIKLLKLAADEEPVLKGEIPINCLEYVMSALGCFLSKDELQMMLNDINFENMYLHEGKKLTLDCMDIVKLYVNYRPREPLTKEKVSEAFKKLISSEENPDKVSKSRFLEILESGGEPLPESELIDIIKCLRDTEYQTSSTSENTGDESAVGLDELKTKLNEAPEDSVIPEIITEEVFFRDILCLEKPEEDLSSYVIKKEDMTLTQDPPTLEDFLLAVEENNVWEDLESS